MDRAMRIRLATGPVCWGVDVAGDPANPPWPTVLDGIAAAGIEWLELGPAGYLPEDPGVLRAELAARGLRAAGAFVFEPLAERGGRAHLRAAAQRAARLGAAAGAEYLLLIDAVGPARERFAGRSADAPRLTGDGRRRLLDAIGGLSAIAADHGLEALVHPHAGSWIEFEDEIAAIADVAPLCLDTGHCAYSGIDPAALLADLGERVRGVHLKDVAGDVRDAVVARRRGFWAGVAAGAFCPLGHGSVDLAAVLGVLAARRFDGWCTIEQDRVPGSGDPVADLVDGRERLERLLAVGEANARG
jgi:inosose dehydratase